VNELHKQTGALVNLARVTGQQALLRGPAFRGLLGLQSVRVLTQDAGLAQACRQHTCSVACRVWGAL